MADPKTPSGFWIPVEEGPGEPIITSLHGMTVKTYKTPAAALQFRKLLEEFLPGAAVTTNIDKPNDYVVRLDPITGYLGIACWPQA